MIHNLILFFRNAEDNRTDELYGTTESLTDKATENDAIYTNDLKVFA